MKKLMLCLQFATALAATPLFAVDSEIEFKHEAWKDILEKGIKENKPVFIDAFADWCGPCRNMAANTFTDSSVASYMNGSYICLKIDVDSDEGKDFTSQYNVEYLPTSFFFDAKGALVVKETGFQDVTSFLALAQRALGQDPVFNEMQDMEKKYAAGDTSMSLLTNLLMKKITYSSNEGVADICERVLRGQRPEVLNVDTFFYAYYILPCVDYNSRLNNYFRDNYETLYNQYGDIAAKKGVELVAARVQDAATEKNKKMRKDAFRFYKRVNSDAKRKEVRKLYKEDLKNNQ